MSEITPAVGAMPPTTENPNEALTQPTTSPQSGAPASVASFAAQGPQPPYEPVPTGSLPGMTPGAAEAVTQPMPVSPQVAVNPWLDPNAIQHMMLATQGLKDFDRFVARNNVARLVPGKRVKSFLRVPNGLVQTQGALSPGLTLDRSITEAVTPSDIYVPVMEDEDDHTAYERYQNDLEKWNGSMVPFRWADVLATRLLPRSLEGLLGGPYGTSGVPLALDDIRAHVARNAPVYGLERFDTEKDLGTVDWTWAVFGGAMKGGSTLATAGMLRFAETTGGQAFMRGLQRAGIGALGEAGLPIGGEGLLGTPMGRSSALFDWLGQRVGSKAFSSVRPDTFKRAEEALRKANAQLRITPEGLDVGLTGAALANMNELKAALQALKAEMSTAGEKAAFRIFTDVPGTFGTAAGGAAAGAAAAADPLGRSDLTPQQRKLIAAGIPRAAVLGGAIPLGFRAAEAAIGALGGREGQPTFRPVPPSEAEGATRYLLSLPRRETPTPPSEPPPRTFGEGPGPTGLPPDRPGPSGPVTPDSGIYSMPLAQIPSIETNGALSTPAGEQFGIQTKVREIQRTLPYIQDPKQLLQTRRLLDGLAAEQTQMIGAVDSMGADPAMLEGRNKAISARLDTVNRLLGKDLAPTSSVLGLPAESLLFDPTLPPEVVGMEPVRMGLLTWAHGVATEATRLGLDLPTLSATLPPPTSPWDVPTMTARIQGLAAQVHATAPDAAVGPPSAMTPDLPDEIRKIKPVQVEPVPSAPLPDPHSLTGDDFPTAAELRSDPVAVRRQTYAASRLASGVRFHVGDLVPSVPNALRDHDPIRIPIHQDASGRLMARAVGSDALETEIEVTDSLTRLALPQAAGWEFLPNPLAPIPYRLDKGQELLEVNRDRFDDLGWARDAYKNAVWNTVQGDMASTPGPMWTPTRIAARMLDVPPTSIEEANGILDRLNKMQAEHEGYRPSEKMARILAGDGASPTALARTQSEMLQDYAGMGALIEYARAVTLAHKARLEAAQGPFEVPFATTPPSPFGEESALRQERHLRGPALYSRAAQILSGLLPEARWTPDILRHRLENEGILAHDYDVIDVAPAFKAWAADHRGTLTTNEALRLVDERQSAAMGDMLEELMGPDGPFQFISDMARDIGGGSKAQTRFDPKLIGALGASQYQGLLGPIVVKELLQNAKDSLMAALESGWNRSEPPSISVIIQDNTITIKDNGIGMNPNVAAKEYVEIGGTFKPGETASGGFGLAKVAYLPNALSIHVETINDTPYGRVKTLLTGSGEEWSDPNRGLPMRVVPAQADEEPGTFVQLEMNDRAKLGSYDSKYFLEDFSRYSDMPFGFEYIIDGVPYPIESLNREEILVHETPAASVRICTFGSETREGGAAIRVGNNGIYQFSSTIYAQTNGQIFPANMWVDVRSRVPVEHPDYPFTTNREALKATLIDSISERVRKDICGKLNENQRDFYKKTLDDAPVFEGAPNFHVIDSTRSIPIDLVRDITKSAEIADLVQTIDSAMRAFLAKLNKLEGAPAQGGWWTKTAGPTGSYSPKLVRFIGLSLNGKHFGSNIDGKAVERPHNLITLNPFASMLSIDRYTKIAPEMVMTQDVAELLAGQLLATMIHEITHQKVRSDTQAEFGGALTTNLGDLSILNAHWVATVAGKLEANDAKLLHTIHQFAGLLEPLWQTGKDAFDAITAHSSRPPGSRDDSSGPPARGGSGSGQRSPLRGSPKDATGGLEPGSPLRGSGTTEEETQARLRAEALARAAANTGWSGRRGTDLFAALTDAERTDALTARIASGRFVNRKHLMAMSPQKWEAVNKFPKYFGVWRPTPGQMTVLKETFNTRLEAYNRSEGTLEKILTAAKPRVTGGVRPPLLSLSDITDIDPSHLDTLVKDPNAFDEWVRQFYRSIDPIADEASMTPEAEAQGKVLQHIDLMKDAVRAMGDTRVLAGTHPYDDPPTAFGGLTRMQAWAHNQQAIMQGRVRQLGRPSYVIGWRKQITHPAEWNENKDELSRNVFHILYSAYLQHAQQLEGYINQTATLHQAASKWMSRKAPKTELSPTALNLNAPPPKDMSPDVVLDRAIATFLDQRPSAAEIEKSAYRFHDVRIGALGKKRIDLAEEMPKLYKIYEELISNAEQASILKNRTEAVRYKARGEALEGELRARILRTARAESPDADYQAFEQLDTDTVNALAKGLRATDEGNRGADPMSIGARRFRSVEAAWRAALRQYTKRNDQITGIQNGDLRREGYYTAVHKLTVDEVRNMLRDPQSVFSRYTTSDVKNFFLNERTSDKEPYRSWAVGWTLYLPAMLRTIHLEPALINATPKIQQLPADLREYADQVVRQLKGELDQTDRLMNHLAVAAWAESPTLSSELGRWTGSDHIAALRNDPEARLQLVGSKAWTKFVEGLAGSAYLALMSPIKVAQMTVTELAFWAREMMKRPQDSLPLLAFGAAGLGRAGFEGVRELASWLHSVGYGGPRWYGEATMMKVTDSLNELALERHTLPTHLDVPARLFKSSVQTWYGVMRATEYSLRASTYYGLKWNARRFGLEEADARELAARMTNDLIGAFGPLETTPSPRGTTGRAVFQFKRFLAAKTDLLTGDFFNTTRLFMPQHDLNLALGHGGGTPPPGTPLGMAEASATPPGGGAPPPAVLRGSSFGDWSPDERNSWDRYAEPVAHMGSSFGSSRTAQWRSFLAFLGLVAAAYPTIGFISQFARLFWQDDDPNAPGQSILDMMFPWDFRRLNAIPMLWPVEYIERIALLEAKKYAPFTGGLTPREDRELKVRKQTMVEAAWPVGAALKQRRYDAQQEHYDEKKQKAQERQFSHPPSRPHRPRREAQAQ